MERRGRAGSGRAAGARMVALLMASNFVLLSMLLFCITRGPKNYADPAAQRPSQQQQQQREKRVRVLAAITGGWSLPLYDTQERYDILGRQLQQYVQACELVGWGQSCSWEGALQRCQSYSWGGGLAAAGSCDLPGKHTL